MASKDGNGFFEDWPGWAKFWLAFAGMIFIGGLWVALPLLNAWRLMHEEARIEVDYEPMMAMYIALATVTITGIFLFMTLRIDRGTRLKAESVARTKVDEIMAEVVAEGKEEMAKAVAKRKKEMAKAVAKGKEEMAERREEMAEAVAEGRKEMAEGREEMAEAVAEGRKEMAERRKEMAEAVADGKEKMDKAVAEERKKMDEAVALEQQKINGLTQQMQGALTHFGTQSEETLESAVNQLRQKYEEKTTPEAIREVIDLKVTEERLREHIEAILMVTANGEIVRRYAAERAERLDPKTVKQLIRLLKEVSEVLLQAIEDKRGFWAKLFRKGPRSAE